jgi:hypothetical protein
MARAAMKQQRISSIKDRTPTTQAQHVELTPATTAGDPTAPTQQRASVPATQKPESNRTIVTEDDVRLRAYQLYLERGDTPGDDLADWLQAERELLAD